ncbi:hypothetical protein RF55_6534 [Lasius niger]|uniref:ATP-dependent DNA helicase n=1 Tax=Lasius niger TaxID=67767 RepID=A0A0J7NLL9_LASNI|nr:hypothetical protein RF55_6534 [Lasius niger]
MAKVPRDCKLIVWDESTMAHKGGFEALSRRGNNRVMGGVTVLLAGDFRQTLPVVPRGTRADEVKACIKLSYLWPVIQRISLKKNIRVNLRGGVSAGQFSELLFKIGDGEKENGNTITEYEKNKKGIGGKGAGKLTAKVISDLTIYYGLAIRRNPDSIEGMKNEIWAAYYHRSSSDDNPQHHLCPPDPESWCKWRKAEALGTLRAFHHEKPPLSDEVLAVLKPIYKDLSSEELLERCLGANTQNNNESLNSLIWTFAPKHLYSGVTTVQIATHFTVCIFNEGFKSILKIMHVMGIKIGPEVFSFVCGRDGDRIARSERRTLNISKEARASKRNENSKLQKFFEEEEGLLYGPGIAD